MFVFDEPVDSVVCIFAHPADAEVSAGATIARFAASGASVVIATVCRGDKGALVATDPTVTAQRRFAEAEQSATRLGARWISLGYDDGLRWGDDRLDERLVELVRECRPQVVITSDPLVVYVGSSHINHRDHRVVGQAAVDAVGSFAPNPNYFPGAGAPWVTRWILLSAAHSPNCVVDAQGFLESKTAALACHVTQLGGGEVDDTSMSSVSGFVNARAVSDAAASSVQLGEAFFAIGPAS